MLGNDIAHDPLIRWVCISRVRFPEKLAISERKHMESKLGPLPSERGIGGLA
jgi:hypothetical protein